VILLDGAAETLVLLGIIILQTNLHFNSLHKLAGFVLGSLEDGIDSLIQRVFRYFAHRDLLVSKVSGNRQRKNILIEMK